MKVQPGGIAEVCYLCGLELQNDRSVDHLPPKQFFARSLRAEINLSQLVTLPAHVSCNRSYGRDEQYFAWSLGPLAMASVAGAALVRDHAMGFRGGRARGLGHTVRREFERQPSGLHLPQGRVVKRVQGNRIARVAWKLVCVLFYSEHARVLSEDTPWMFDLIEPMRAEGVAGNALWEEVKAQPAKGVYPGVFDYKYFAGEIDGHLFHSWGMLLWDRWMLFAARHDSKTTDRGAV